MVYLPLSSFVTFIWSKNKTRETGGMVAKNSCPSLGGGGITTQEIIICWSRRLSLVYCVWLQSDDHASPRQHAPGADTTSNLSDRMIGYPEGVIATERVGLWYGVNQLSAVPVNYGRRCYFHSTICSSNAIISTLMKWYLTVTCLLIWPPSPTTPWGCAVKRVCAGMRDNTVCK